MGHISAAIERLAQISGSVLVAGIWQGFVLLCAVWLCLRTVPRASAALRFSIWALVFGFIVILPVAEHALRAHPVQPAGASIVALDPRWSLTIAALWAALSLYRAAALAVHALQLRSLAKRSKEVRGRSACGALLASGRRPIALCTSDEVERPSVIGFIAPRILIPAWLFEQLTEAELEQIVLHEMEHLRRRDDWLNLMQKCALVLLPLNPVLLWIERRLCLERELACDDGVLRRTNAPRAYATCLTSLAERGLDHSALTLALGAIDRQSQLARRVQRILRREASLTPVRTRGLIAAVCLVLFGGAIGLARCPQLVSFDRTTQPVSASIDLPNETPPQSQPVIGDLMGAGTPQPFHVEDVVYHQQRPPQLYRAAATQPAPRRTELAKNASTSLLPRRRTARPRLQQEAVHPDEDRAWVMLAAWPEEYRPRLVLPVAIDSSLHPYAAVRVTGGWLIVQL